MARRSTGATSRETPRLGVLLYSTPKDDPQARALQQGLRDHNYIDGQNISVDYRFAEGKAARLPTSPPTSCA